MRAINFFGRRPIIFLDSNRSFSAVGFCTVVKRTIIISNGAAGAENQCLGLVRALGLSHQQTIYHVTRPTGGINKWLRWLPVSVHRRLNDITNLTYSDLKAQMAFGSMVLPISAAKKGYSSSLEADARMTFETIRDGPVLVVASGRDTISVASSLKRLAPESVFLVQIQHPRSRMNRFDLVITPRHDYYGLTAQGQKEIAWFLRWLITPSKPERHVVLTIGALHRFDSTTLAVASSAWHDELASLSKPLLVVNIGGPTGNCEYGTELANELVSSLKKVIWSCGSIRISFSRRTPKKVSDIVMQELGDNLKVQIWNGKDSNPHLGNLAWADAFLITADSISMLSEACSTGKPVYVIGSELCKWKFSEFHRSLKERGAVRTFTGREDISNVWRYPPLNDTAEAANRVVEALAERGLVLHP
ncbi:mitochondrial fission protein ELM1-like [Impatiens glandulifera]|uniref:mitochondrial fission protein ELM1-like n=1 Tax=Impatiens glandulifera TaxID=253017 RepID=UPI001FB0BA1B|nr:mitochondrial fission protein ELM1-like [Impatiens glandulifera]